MAGQIQWILQDTNVAQLMRLVIRSSLSCIHEPAISGLVFDAKVVEGRRRR